MVLVTDHCVARIVDRLKHPFDYAAICEQVETAVLAAGCGSANIPFAGGTIVLENGIAVTFLDKGMRPKRRRKRLGL